MSLSVSVLFYLLIGAGVAGSIVIVGDNRRWFVIATAALFWPIYLPILLSTSGKEQTNNNGSPADRTDELAEAIEQVQLELADAAQGLEHWAADLFDRQSLKLSDLYQAWAGQAERIRQIDRVLTQPGFVVGADSPLSTPARREHVDRLRRVRQDSYDELTRTLAWVHELVAMIHLARFTGQPADRAEELIAQIAAVVEGLSEVQDWQEPEPTCWRSTAYSCRESSRCDDSGATDFR